MHTNISEQANRNTTVKFDKYIHIAVLTFLTTGKGTKEPCFQDGLRLEVFGYLLCHHLCTHCPNIYIYGANIRNIF